MKNEIEMQRVLGGGGETGWRTWRRTWRFSIGEGDGMVDGRERGGGGGDEREDG